MIRKLTKSVRKQNLLYFAMKRKIDKINEANNNLNLKNNNKIKNNLKENELNI